MVLLKREVLYNYLRIATAHLTTNCALPIVLIYIRMPLIFYVEQLKLMVLYEGELFGLQKLTSPDLMSYSTIS